MTEFTTETATGPCPLAQLHRFLALEDILIGFTDGIDYPRLEAGLNWAKHGLGPQAPSEPLIFLFMSPWLAAAEEGEWEGHVARGEALKDIFRITAEAEAPKVEQEPVARVVSAHGDPEAFGEREIEVLKDLSGIPYDTPLYTSAPASDELLEALGKLVTDWHGDKLSTAGVMNGIDALIAKHKRPQS